MNTVVVKASLLLVVAVITGCSGGDFPTAKVSGMVTCEGTPVANAMVFFEPLRTNANGTAVVGKQGFGFTDEAGKYVLATYGKGDGAVVGKHRVRVGGPEAKCNCSLNEERTLMEVEVKEGENNAFDITLPPATREDAIRARMNREEEDDA